MQNSKNCFIHLVYISTWKVQQITRFQHRIQDRWWRQVSVGEICFKHYNITDNHWIHIISEQFLVQYHIFQLKYYDKVHQWVTMVIIYQSQCDWSQCRKLILFHFTDWCHSVVHLPVCHITRNPASHILLLTHIWFNCDMRHHIKWFFSMGEGWWAISDGKICWQHLKKLLI